MTSNFIYLQTLCPADEELKIDRNVTNVEDINNLIGNTNKDIEFVIVKANGTQLYSLPIHPSQMELNRKKNEPYFL